MTWEIILDKAVDTWFLELAVSDPTTANQVAGAIDVLSEDGPTLGRPLVDKVNRSDYHNMKELRPGSSGTTEIRILFAFDPVRRAILLVAGDKAGSWNRWYDENIPLADARYKAHLDDMEGQR